MCFFAREKIKRRQSRVVGREKKKKEKKGKRAGAKWLYPVRSVSVGVGGELERKVGLCGLQVRFRQRIAYGSTLFSPWIKTAGEKKRSSDREWGQRTVGGGDEVASGRCTFLGVKRDREKKIARRTKAREIGHDAKESSGVKKKARERREREK